MRFIFLALILASAVPLHAQDLPDQPIPARHSPDRRIFWSGLALLSASGIADGITTRQLLDRGGWENNPLFGSHPSIAAQAGIGGAIFGAQVALFRYTEANRRPWVRWAGRAAIAFAIEQHGRMAACNARVDTNSPKAHNCPLAF